MLPSRARDVLEVGCGQGGFGVRLARRYRYVGIDPDSTSIEIARSRFVAHGVNGDLREGDLSALVADERFDIVCAFEVIEHIEDDGAMLASWVGRLRPGGVLLVSAPAWQGRFGPWDELAGHYRRYDPEHLERLLTGAGLTGVHAEAFGAPLGFLLEAMRNTLARRRGVGVSGESFADRTAASGRLMRLPDGPRALIPWFATLPFAVAQSAFRGRGPSAVAVGRLPAGAAGYSSAL